jgi:hypothetical protein
MQHRNLVIVDKVVGKAQWVLYQIFGLVLIVAVFLGLAIAHAELGGFATPWGAMVGILALTLFFSPIIDWILELPPVWWTPS